MASSSDQSLGTRTIRGMFWAYGAYVGGRSVVLVSTAILARLLTPADFGVVALALVFMTFLETAAMNRQYAEAEAVLLAGRGPFF